MLNVVKGRGGALLREKVLFCMALPVILRQAKLGPLAAKFINQAFQIFFAFVKPSIMMRKLLLL